MLKTTVSNWVSTAGANIPLVTALNTNNKIQNNNGVISLLKPAIWEVNGALTLTSATAGDYAINVLADGVVVSTFTSTIATANDFVTVPIVDVIRTIAAPIPSTAEISLQATTGATISGVVIVKYIN